jgi:hypothetical protein
LPSWAGGFDKISQISLPQGVRQQLSMDILKYMPPPFPEVWGVSIDKCITFFHSLIEGSSEIFFFSFLNTFDFELLCLALHLFITSFAKLYDLTLI